MSRLHACPVKSDQFCIIGGKQSKHGVEKRKEKTKTNSSSMSSIIRTGSTRQVQQWEICVFHQNFSSMPLVDFQHDPIHVRSKCGIIYQSRLIRQNLRSGGNSVPVHSLIHCFIFNFFFLPKCHKIVAVVDKSRINNFKGLPLII